MSRTLKQQVGLEDDPHAKEHFVSPTGQRLTKVISREASGSHLAVYHRRIGDPAPLFALSIGAILIVLGLLAVHVRGLQSPQIYLNIGLPLGGVATITSAMVAFAEGNTFLATLAMILGGILGGLSLVSLPWTGIQAAYAQAAGGNPILTVLLLYKGIGVITLVSLLPVLIIIVGSLKTAAPVAFSAFLIFVSLILQGTAYVNYPMSGLQTGAGALLIVVGLNLWVAALSGLLAEAGIKLLPVVPFPHMDD